MEERKHCTLHVLEFGMRLVTGVHKVLDLSLSEFSLTSQTCPGSNLVSEGPPNLCHAKGQTIRVLLAAEFVVQEDALCSLGPEVTLQVASWTDWSWEHEVELIGIAEIVPRLWRLDAILFEHFPDLLLRIGISLIPNRGVLLPLGLCEVWSFELLFHNILQQLICTEELGLIHHIFHHEIIESINMSRRLQHWVLHDASVLNL
mmetsp:Transcript_61874/g.109930  ORF Transcript_61874/g.109930 Transcript_61874/m.109930 type:complete len:203 (-) Transcript_61874:422-1030(-)